MPGRCAPDRGPSTKSLESFVALVTVACKYKGNCCARAGGDIQGTEMQLISRHLVRSRRMLRPQSQIRSGHLVPGSRFMSCPCDGICLDHLYQGARCVPWYLTEWRLSSSGSVVSLVGQGLQPWKNEALSQDPEATEDRTFAGVLATQTLFFTLLSLS